MSVRTVWINTPLILSCRLCDNTDTTDSKSRVEPTQTVALTPDPDENTKHGENTGLADSSSSGNQLNPNPFIPFFYLKTIEDEVFHFSFAPLEDKLFLN